MARHSTGIRGVTVRRLGDPVATILVEIPLQEDGAPLAAVVAEHRSALLALVPETSGANPVPVLVRRGPEEVLLPRSVAASPGEAAGTTSPVMTRLDAAAVQQLDLLVGAGVCRSRSDAVAWCVRRTLARESRRIAALEEPVAALWNARAQLLRPDAPGLNAEARRVLGLAEQEARTRHYRHAGTEHLFLAILAVGDGPAITILRNLGVPVEAVAAELGRSLGTGDGESPKEIQFTPRGTTVIEDLAPEEARRLGAADVGALHLLLALAAEEQSLVARTLSAHGADLERLRAEAARLGTQA